MVILKQFDWMGLNFSGARPNCPLPPSQGVSFTFRMGTRSLLSNTDEITVCVKQNWTCCLRALHAFYRTIQNQDHPGVRPCNSGASRRSWREAHRVDKCCCACLEWTLFTHACCALGLTGFKDECRYLCILWTKTLLNVSTFLIFVITN